MIRIRGPSFIDEHGRTLMLRGVNLGGSSKVPRVPNGATHIAERFYDHRDVSFIGRPFPLAEADEHFSRLRSWGFTFLRFLVTWEAIEHAGPGIYDEAYLDYLRAVIGRAKEHGISLLIDPHQDMWSRFSGGDGAPGWTLEAVGFDLRRLDATGAAITHQVHGDPLPDMIWPSNGGKLAAATMFTLFFGGSDFAPRTMVDGMPVQEFLQQHYLGAFSRVADRLSDMPNVVGYGTMNEPLCGYIGCADLTVPRGQITLEHCPSPFQGMLLGAGIPQEVGYWVMKTASIRRMGARVVNAEGLRAWREGFDCPWRVNGVWDFDSSGTPRLLRPDHFIRAGSRPIDFTQDYFRPFAERFASAIRTVNPRAFLFLEAEVNHAPPRLDIGGRPGIVFAPHWYDDLTLVKKRYYSFVALDSRTLKLVVGRGAIRRSFHDQLQSARKLAQERLDSVPTLLAEFGVPFDLKGRKAYRKGDFHAQVNALDRSYRAVEAALLDSTIWNYTADNTNARGDLWNGEDLSVFSRDQQQDLADVNSGGRGLPALLRPYPRATAGTPLRLSFDMRHRIFVYEFRHDPGLNAPTEIFVPNWQYPDGYTVEVSDGTWERRGEDQLFIYRHGPDRRIHAIRLMPKRRR